MLSLHNQEWYVYLFRSLYSLTKFVGFTLLKLGLLSYFIYLKLQMGPPFSIIFSYFVFVVFYIVIQFVHEFVLGHRFLHLIFKMFVLQRTH